MWYVYLLVSQNLYYNNHCYVGITTDLNRRLDQHNGIIAGGAKSTSAKRPYKIAFYLDNINDRSNASRLEYNIKKYKGFEKRLEYMQFIKNTTN